MAEPIVGIDLGGTQIRAVLAKDDGTILARYKTLTAPEEGQDAILERIVRAARAVMNQGGRRSARGLGVGSPGMLDCRRGVVVNAVNLGWQDVPLRSLLEDRLGLPTVVGNDVNASTLAEWRFGAGQGIDDLVYLTISTGIASGIISGGRLVLGARGWAGEIGHATVEPYGPPCKCGSIGCLEALASGPAIARNAIASIRDGHASTMTSMVQGELSRLTAQDVGRAANQGDALAIETIRRAAFYVGVSLASLTHILDPELILIGGGVAHIGDLLFGTIRATVQERVISCLAQAIRIEPVALGDDTGVLGAIALFLEYGDA